MTRSYTERHFDLNAREWVYEAEWSFTVYHGDNEHFTVCRDGAVKTVLVEESWEYVYGLRKSKVLAMGGARGLFDFIDKELADSDLSVWAWKVLKHCFFTCKEAKK